MVDNCASAACQDPRDAAGGGVAAMTELALRAGRDLDCTVWLERRLREVGWDLVMLWALSDPVDGGWPHGGTSPPDCRTLRCEAVR